jgi:hypothetical protein
MLDKFNEVLEQYNTKQQQLKNMFEDTLKEVVKEFFTKYDDILAITWTGYVPYFSDGDPCEFSISDFRFISTREVSEEEYEYYEDLELEDKYYAIYDLNKLREWKDRKYVAIEGQEAKWTDFTKLEQFINGNENLVRYLFGDHHKVVVTKDTINVEEYVDHD